MTITHSRVTQYIGILLALGLIAVGYWYFSAKAGTRLNTSLTDTLSEGLVGYWPLDDGSGVMATDASGNGNNGTLTNGPTWGTGQIGGATVFDGTDDYIDAGTGVPIAGKSTVTLSAWVKINSFTFPSGFFHVLGRWSGSDAGRVISARLSNSTTIGLATDNGAGQLVSGITIPALSTGTWYHMTWTYSAGNGSFYLNGVKQGDFSGLHSALNASPVTSNFTLGRDSATSGVANSSLDEARVYSRVLSADEVAKLYKTTSPGNPAANLVGYWSFDGADISGTTAADRSGKGNNGTLTNGPTKTNGIRGQALSFDGANDYITIPHSSTLEPDQITVSAWVYANSWTYASEGWAGIVSKRDPGSTGPFGLYVNEDGSADARKITFSQFRSTTPTTATVPTILNTRTWYHIVGTVGSDMMARIYVNGILQNTGTAGSGTVVSNSGRNVRIGAQRLSTEFFNGSIDEVRIYNTALTAAQIYDLYKSGSEAVGVSNPTRNSLDYGLAGYWKFDDGSGTTATDSSTNGNNGTLTNGPTWGTGQIGGDVDIDGANDYIDIGDVLDVVDGQDFSISGWFYRDTENSGDIIFYKGTVTGLGYYVTLTSNIDSDVRKLKLRVSDGTDAYTVVSSQTIVTGVWTHFVAVFNDDSTTGTSLYINGALDASTKTGTLSNVNDMSSTASLRIGATSYDGSGVFDGKLDEIRMYNRVLSAEEVTNLYKTTTPGNPDTRLKGYWSFDGDAISGTSALDLSGAGNNGTLTNGPAKTIGVRGQAMSFDGVDDFATVTHASSLNMSSNWSVGAWVNASDWYSGTCRANSILEKGDDANNGWYGLRIGDSGGCGVATGIENPHFFVRFSDGTQGSVLGNSVLQLNTWYYLSGTFDGTYLRIYVNGVLDTTSVSYGGKSVSSNSNALTIGKLAHAGYEYWFHGKLDEVRIYNAALTSSEIWNLYQEGGVKVNKSQSNNGDSLNDGLAGYWKLDDASGTTATDSSVNSGNGTLTNGPTWGTGQIGGATTFDGTNDYITVPDSSALRPGNGDFTVSVWANPPNTNQLAFLVSKTAGNPGYSMRICGADPSCGGYSGKRFVFTYAESMVAPIYRGAYSTADIADGSWHLFTAVADKTANLIRLYVDGKEIAANQGTGGSWPNITNTEALILGSFTGSNYYHTGSLDEVRVYNRALSAEEVTRLYKTTSPTNPETGLVGYWSFNGSDMSGTTAYDRSGKGNTGTLTNGPTLTIGRVGQAVNFDGVNDSIVTPSIAMDPANGRSFSAWFKINSLAAEANILNQNSTILSVRTDGSIRFYWTGGGYHYSSGITLTTGTWYHVVGVETATSGSNYKVYINGTKYLDEDDVNGHYGGSGVLTIGSYSSALYFPGVIDEVRAYTKSLTATEVSTLYNLGR